MKKFAILLSLSLITGVLFSACSLIQVEEATPTDSENGTAVDLSVEVTPASEEAEAPSVSIPLAVNVQ